jgi:hypothetical protein
VRAFLIAGHPRNGHLRNRKMGLQKRSKTGFSRVVDHWNTNTPTAAISAAPLTTASTANAISTFMARPVRRHLGTRADAGEAVVAGSPFPASCSGLRARCRSRDHGHAPSENHLRRCASATARPAS